MTSTQHSGIDKKSKNKFSHIFKKTANNHSTPPANSPKWRERAQSAGHENNTKLKHRLISCPPQTTTGYATHSKAFAFQQHDDSNINHNKLSSPKSKHKPNNSLNFEQNPLATANTQQTQTNDYNVNLQDLMNEMDAEKVNINIKDSDDEDNRKNDGSYSYSYDALQDDTIDFFPPGYNESTKSRANTMRGSKSGNDDDIRYKRRKSNRKDIWRRMMQSVVDGVGSLGANAMQLINEDDEDDEDEDPFSHLMQQNNLHQEAKYDTDIKYESVTKNNRLFRHNGYKIQRRFSSHEVLHSRYTSKCYRRKSRPRSKSDPNLLPHTKRFYRKLETEYRPGTMNIFMMKSEKKEDMPSYPTRAHQDSIAFRYIFDDSDFEDDSFDEWSEEELDSLLRTYDMEVAEAPIMEYKNDDNNNNNNNNDNDGNNNNMMMNNGNAHNFNNFNNFNNNLPSMASIGGKLKQFKSYSKSLPGHIEKGIGKIKSVSTNNINKVPIKPYGGHVEATESMIEEEFGSTMQHIKEYTVKKRNKLGRDKNRIAVVDIPLQVLRIKDKNGKTHKEHIVSSISDHALVGSESSATQIIIKFHDNRDYFLTFDSCQKCIEFRNLIEKLRKFNLKMVTNRQDKKPKMSINPINREIRANSMSNTSNTSSYSTILLKPAKVSNSNNNNNHGFFDDDDEASMSAANHPNGGHLNIIQQQKGSNNKYAARYRFDTEFFDEAADDGNVYTGMQTSNVVYRIIKINKWGTKKERTMIVHKADRTVRLFDDKRRCHSEYPLKIMATLDIIDSLNVEVVFTLDQKPTQFVFRSHIDLWDFVEQIRTIAPNEIMVNDRRIGNRKKLTMAAKNTKDENKKIRATTKDMLGLEDDIKDNNNNDGEECTDYTFDEDLDINPNVLRYSVLRLIRSAARVRGAVNQQVTWRQHRRCIYLDLEKRIVRMLTLGMHIKDYKFEDILLLEKSYVNVNQLHITCKHLQKIKEYWYEFVSPQARAEFVGRLLRALPGTKQSQSPLNNTTEYNDESGSREKKKKSSSSDDKDNNNRKYYKPQINIYADLTTAINNGNVQQFGEQNPNISTQSTISPRSKKKRRKRLSSEAIRGLLAPNDNANISKSAPAPNPNDSNLDVGLPDDEMNGYQSCPSPPTSFRNKHFTEDPLSIIVGSWNVSESEINYANLQMWIPPSKIEPHDIYVIGLQECAQGLRKQWISGILRHIDSGRGEYVLLNKAWLMGIGIIIIVHRAHVCKISHLHSQVVPTGKGNIIGNKGATAISFQFQETSFAFINAHLAARAEKFEKRAKNFNRIIKNLELGRPGLDVLHQFTHTFFLGDLNYRIEREFFETVNMVKMKKWSELIKNDQLRYHMDKNHVFYGFEEGEINFCPTYRWERNKNTISNKREQPPSYCDRILYKSLPQTFDLWQECYLSSHRCFGSDHRPVWSLFKFKPKMPYFTLPSHDNKVTEIDDKSRNDTNYTNISISLVELQASFRELQNNLNISGKNKDKNKIQIHLDDEIDIILHYNYAAKPIRLKGGRYDYTSRYWRWPIEVLDALRIKPFIPDPEFLCRTHIYVCFLNVSKGNLCIGYSIISLFNAFPKSLIDTNKLIKEYRHNAKQMTLMPSSNHNGYNQDETNGLSDDLKSQFISNTASGNKQFDIPVLLYGNKVGALKGFVYADGSIIQKHRKITNLDLLSKYEQKTTAKYGLFQKASARFINVKK